VGAVATWEGQRLPFALPQTLLIPMAAEILRSSPRLLFLVADKHFLSPDVIDRLPVDGLLKIDHLDPPAIDSLRRPE